MHILNTKQLGIKSRRTFEKINSDLNFKTILEIGCGFGRYTKILSNLFVKSLHVYSFIILFSKLSKTVHLL